MLPASSAPFLNVAFCIACFLRICIHVVRGNNRLVMVLDGRVYGVDWFTTREKGSLRTTFSGFYGSLFYRFFAGFYLDRHCFGMEKPRHQTGLLSCER